ncbi:MAG: metallophosphoesterase [Christensenellaceae bacterium]|jgi:predicted phosphodiesterase|nr:metallophosphoesterase [Christensenellaceae bacterium]
MSSNRKKLLINIIVILLSIIFVLSVAMLGIYINETSVLLGSSKLNEGPLKSYIWSSSDDFSAINHPVITTNDGSIKILQLTDIHYKNMGTFGSQFGINHITDGYMMLQTKALVKTHKPDLIIITGDLLTYSAADVAYKELAHFFDSLNVPWTVAFGNHDGEYNSDKASLSNILENSKNSIFQTGPTNLEGLGHHVILVKNSAGILRQALILMDSGDEVLLKYPNRSHATLEPGFYSKQLEWFEYTLSELTKLNDSVPIPVSLFYHINIGGNPESPNALKTLSHAYPGTGYVFFGHTHLEGHIIEEDGVVYVNGVKGGINYMDNGNRTGGTVATLNSDGSATIKFVYTRLFTMDDSEQYTFINQRLLDSIYE